LRSELSQKWIKSQFIDGAKSPDDLQMGEFLPFQWIKIMDRDDKPARYGILIPIKREKVTPNK